MAGIASKKTWFRWGMLLAWSPFVVVLGPTIFVVLYYVLPEIASQRATGVTGMGAMSGWMGESFALFGLLATLAFESVALALLGRSLSKEHPGRAVLAVLSMGVCVLMLALVVGFAWLALR